MTIVTLNWGILGAGNISAQFVHDLVLNNQRDTQFHHIVKSIGCSNHDKGLEFIKKNNITADNNFQITPIVESYEDFYKNSDIDVVYIGTPHTFHKEQSIACLNNDKHVLCEKPVTVNRAELETILSVAKSKKKFFMEAMWTRFFPAITELKKKIYDEKVIGEIYRLFADLSYNCDISNVPLSSRIRDKNLAAGSLLDIGIYPITYSRILLDDNLGADHSPFQIKSFLTIDSQDRVDHLYSAIVKYQNGKHAVLTASELVDGPKAYVRLECSQGHVEMYSDNPARAKHFKVFNAKGDEIFEYKDDSGYNGFIYEANAVAKDIADGKLSNNTMPHDESLLIMETMDQIRHENGLVYPQDES
ncbi:oxidoreductase, putative [Candida dubliniensis CD36]|uniref:D-xylose 1-dehydrogenase (NADP(+), D-xylono-1,5-lactone-forming) n=1 Tax=Candida dubliniensis (strain CD36 / ATCC MYA-646 / CBS 7987 / NCPF 3949 / NRRL Y-17841) TaxID=573826 RepID=B9WAE2_CANDC|nr:oxidoreductase, putative [Candida dubliniensis CD36]CAX43361.1 oxidoreductase, putative [Candida dubliniensis CD36]